MTGTSPTLVSTVTNDPASIMEASALPAINGNLGTESCSVTPIAVNAFLDPAVKSLADGTTSHVHGGLASALNVHAAIYRAKQLSSGLLVSAINVLGPVTLLNAINVDTTDLNLNSSGKQRRRTARS